MNSGNSNWLNYLYNPTVLLVLFILLIIIIIYWYVSMKPSTQEHFRKPEEALQLDERGEEIIIKPPMVRADTKTLMSGSGFIPQKEVIPAWGYHYGVNDQLNPGLDGVQMMYDLCSPACCSEQWPTPFKLPYDRFVCKNKSEFMPNSYKCNNAWQNSGCTCMTKKQYKFLEDRGNNQ